MFFDCANEILHRYPDDSWRDSTGGRCAANAVAATSRTCPGFDPCVARATNTLESASEPAGWPQARLAGPCESLPQSSDLAPRTHPLISEAGEAS
jgi:hypothetical protein